MIEIDFANLSGSNTIILIIGVVVALLNWGPAATKTIIEFFKGLNIQSFITQQVVPRIPSKSQANKLLLIVAFIAMMPGVFKFLHEKFPNEGGNGPHVEHKHDYVDTCHETYRQLLGELYVEFGQKDISDPETYDQFEGRRDALYKATYENWNRLVQRAAEAGTLADVGQALIDREIKEEGVD